MSILRTAPGELPEASDKDPDSDPHRRQREVERRRRELATLVVHDLRNPLGAILGHLELLRNELSAQDRPVPTSVGDLEGLARHALGLLATLLDVEELEDGLLLAHRESVDLEAFLAPLSATYLPQAQARHITFTVALAPGATAIFDANLIGRVIENLLDNAVRYANRRGRVDLCIEHRPGALELRIGNDGPAVPTEDLARIFERYYRIEARRAAARENRGLGLYFCKLAIAAHGGTIEVESRAELPTIFVVTLPQP